MKLIYYKIIYYYEGIIERIKIKKNLKKYLKKLIILN